MAVPVTTTTTTTKKSSNAREPAMKRSYPKVKIALTGTPETTLVPLIAKALDARHPRPLLNDPWASTVLEQLDHDDLAKYKIGDRERVTYAQRARYLDRWTAEFLARHPRATVVHLACGLDSRSLRLPWRQREGVRWIDLDLPAVVAIRRQLLPSPSPSNPAKGDCGEYALVGADVTDDAWLRAIPADRPTVVIFEGLSMYLPEPVGKDLIRRLVGRFPTGQLLFDAVGSVVVRLQRYEAPIVATGAAFVWAVDEPRQLEALDPRRRLRLLDRLRPTEREGFEAYPPAFRAILIVYSWLWWFRDVSSFLRYEF
ncbi:putative polyketide synthase protein [Xylariomycetidae sp. FL2044]|nr:putative polyketide synthase protein [Xylariomycetidae sp. FL2044]